MACPAQEERTVLKVRRVVLDPLVSSDPLGWWERRVNLAFLDFLVTLVDWAPRDPLVSLDSLVPMERRERGV